MRDAVICEPVRTPARHAPTRHLLALEVGRRRDDAGAGDGVRPPQHPLHRGRPGRGDARRRRARPGTAGRPEARVAAPREAQERAGRQLAARGQDRFAQLSWRATTGGAVLLDGASGWLDTSVEQQIRAGDHDIVVLRVHDLDADHDVTPLVFHASRFHRIQR